MRTYFVDAVSLMGCAWDGINTFLDTLGNSKSFGQAFVGGASTFFNTVIFGFHVAEKIMYPIIENTMKLPFIPEDWKKKSKKKVGPPPEKAKELMTDPSFVVKKDWEI